MNWILIIGGEHDGDVYEWQRERTPLTGERIKLAVRDYAAGSMLEVYTTALASVHVAEYVIALVRVRGRSFYYASPEGTTEETALERLFGCYAGLPNYQPTGRAEPPPQVDARKALEQIAQADPATTSSRVRELAWDALARLRRYGWNYGRRTP